MKITTHTTSPPDEVKVILSREEAYALMAVVAKVSGPERIKGELTIRGHCSMLYRGLTDLGFEPLHKREKKNQLTGSLRCEE